MPKPCLGSICSGDGAASRIKYGLFDDLLPLSTIQANKHGL
jgi:hypothetical protein